MPLTISEGKSLSATSAGASPAISANDAAPKILLKLGTDATVPSRARYRVFPWVWEATNVLLLLSLALVCYSVAWEESTRVYLKGFSDAVVPVPASPIDKVESILTWMSNGPHRPSAGTTEVNHRDPEETLNYHDLLRVCGTATNAFINVARSSGLSARRLLLTDHWGQVWHVVAEVQVDGRWIVVDPAFRTIMRDSSGNLLSRDQMRVPANLAAATSNIPGYDLTYYRYDRTERIRLAKIPLIGNMLRPLASYWPTWSDSLFWTMLVERESFGFMILSFIIFVSLLFFRVALRWYAEKRLGLRTSRMRTHLARIGAAWLEGSSDTPVQN
jgi:hypothetical protein